MLCTSSKFYVSRSPPTSAGFPYVYRAPPTIDRSVGQIYLSITSAACTTPGFPYVYHAPCRSVGRSVGQFINKYHAGLCPPPVGRSVKILNHLSMYAIPQYHTRPALVYMYHAGRPAGKNFSITSAACVPRCCWSAIPQYHARPALVYMPGPVNLSFQQ